MLHKLYIRVGTSEPELRTFDTEEFPKLWLLGISLWVDRKMDLIDYIFKRIYDAVGAFDKRQGYDSVVFTSVDYFIRVETKFAQESILGIAKGILKEEECVVASIDLDQLIEIKI